MSKTIYILLISIFICGKIYSADSDSTNAKNKNTGTEYPIDDPRNPNCPCHVLQKIADDEFKKHPDDNNSNNVIANVTKRSQNSGWGVSFGKSRHKRNSVEKFFFKLSRKLSGRHKKRRKIKIKIDECYMWM